MGPITNLPDMIFLCGFMGTGKSTIGKALAGRLLVPYRDLDDIVRQKAGKSIKAIFKDHGEKGFRSMEREHLLDIIRNCKGVLSMGGGVLQNQHVVDHIKLSGLLIFIETPFSVILERIFEDQNRPLLLGEDGNVKEKDILQKELMILYNKRLKFYRQAEITIQTKYHASVEDNVTTLVGKIRNHVSHY